MVHLLQIGKSRSPNLTFGAAKKGAQMEARQEVRLKEAEAADQKETANRVRFAEPTASIIDICQTEVHTNSTRLSELSELTEFGLSGHHCHPDVLRRVRPDSSEYLGMTTFTTVQKKHALP
jgi:hypothetical protein